MSTLTGLKTSEFNTGNTALGSDVLYNDQLIANFINGGNFDLTNISASMSPSWTGTHTFEALKIKIKGGGAGVLALQYATSASNRSYTIPDAGANASFILDTGDSNFDSGTLFIDATNNRVYVGSTSSVYTTLFQVIKTSAGGDVDMASFNLDNTNSNSHATLGCVTGGSSAGDPRIFLGIIGVLDWSIGIDNSDSDKFKIGASGTVGTNTALTIDTSLNTAIPATKKFYLDGGTGTYLSESSTNVMDLVVGSTTVLQLINLSGPTRQGAAIPATKKLFLDGGSNTSIRERTADTITFEIGGSDLVEIASTGEVSLPAIDPPAANKTSRYSGCQGYANFTEGSPGFTTATFNVSSVTDSASAGIYTVAWNTDFNSSTSYICVGSARTDGNILTIDSRTSSSTAIHITNAAGTLIDDDFHCVAYGVQ